MPAPGGSRWHEAMGAALAAGAQAGRHGDIPVGAVVLDPEGAVIATGANERELLGDPTAHAEIVALRRAASVLGSWRLDDCTLVVTLEPCTMCAGAVVQARVGRLVFGAYDDAAGAVASLFDVVRDPRLTQKVSVTGGVRAPECTALIDHFFASRRRPR